MEGCRREGVSQVYRIGHLSPQGRKDARTHARARRESRATNLLRALVGDAKRAASEFLADVVVRRKVRGISKHVTDLHTSRRRCRVRGAGGARIGRAGLQDWLSRVNPQVNALPAAPAPDGDAQLARELDGVRVPECADCGAIVKPDVVFYGESVPPERVREAYRWVDEADALMVVGSSLMVYSSYRFVRRARERGLPLVAINQGKTRADDWWHFKLAEDCTSALQRLVGELSGAVR